MEKKWIFKESPEQSLIHQLSKEINVNPIIAKLLIQRGIESFESAKEFFRPSLKGLNDPFLMKGMDKAVNRLCDAVFNHEKILLYGDYDVDGTTSVSLLYLFLKEFTEHVEYYIPDRYSEGYGISEKGINWAQDNGVSLVIALDCGIRAVDRAVQAKDSGIDLIICDHHLPGDELPEALAILDPKQPDCNYPFKELSGCGVGFKLLEGFCQQNTIPKEQLFDLLDLLAVSISSDLVPILEENRILTYYGLRKLNQSPTKGLRSLKEISGKKHDFTVTDVVFTIGPRINAAGRLAHAKESVKLLIGEGSGTEGAELLNTKNQERKSYDQSITKEALEMIAASQANQKSTVLFKESWHKGVIGIVASRCIEHYYRPTIILTQSNGLVTGSARSIDGFNIHDAIGKCSDLLEQYGGHKYAAGVTMKKENVAAFQSRFEELVSESLSEDQLVPKVLIDSEMHLSAISFKVLSILNQMEPFGPGNLSPIFGTKNVYMKTLPQVMKEEHMKGFVFEEGNERAYEFIGFGLAEKGKLIEANKPFHIAYHLEENNFLQQKSIILNLKDIQFD